MERVPIEMMMVKSFEFVNNGALPLFLLLERALADVSPSQRIWMNKLLLFED